MLARGLNCAAEKEADGSDATDSVCVEVWEHGLIGLWANHVEGVRFSLLTKSRPGMARQFSPIILQEAILPAMRIEAASDRLNQRGPPAPFGHSLVVFLPAKPRVRGLRRGREEELR